MIPKPSGSTYKIYTGSILPSILIYITIPSFSTEYCIMLYLNTCSLIFSITAIFTDKTPLSFTSYVKGSVLGKCTYTGKDLRNME
jgi:hypothetical protein